ncbi:MAG: ABC transporter [Chloroflexi bacterium HGW-Chloroflexi-4]|jgi:simple sugar transport system ATP-binding protein|nr:MAG: ABC transporter [Chloroflexi bacterium HGW-Chloroflexi-4]
MKNISIDFPGVKALSNVDFSIASGNIHALVGANGAGKSTLMKIMAGAYNHYSGAIYLNGEEVAIRSPRDAKNIGIEIVYQEVDTALVPYLTVAENIMLNVLVNKMDKQVFVRWPKIHQAARQILKRLNIQIDTNEIVQNLKLAQKQMVLIARAIAEDCRFLILDEPTAPLSNTETVELFRLLKDLTQNHNVGIIFISHRLPEIFEVCKDITIMKDGQVVTRKSVTELSVAKVVEFMLGQKLSEVFPKRQVEIGETIFEVNHLTEKEDAVKEINLYVRSGEIVGVTGLVGAGKTELCKTIFGSLKTKSGEIKLNGKKITIKSPFSAVTHGLALVPEERRKEGVLVEEPVFSNLSAATLAKFSTPFGFIKSLAEKLNARKMINDLAIKTPSENQKVAFLSGGNQQKVAVGKWLNADADIFIFDEPTKGVDVGAKHDIFELIGRLAAAGKGVIYATCEFTEILGITDRAYVMYDGQIAQELVTANTDEEKLLFYSTGGK